MLGHRPRSLLLLSKSFPQPLLAAAFLFSVASAVHAAPVVTSFSPGGGPPGTSVTVRGTGFSTATAVRFNGINASHSVQSDSVIATSVPGGAATGPISVTDGTNTSFSTTNFYVGYAPSVSYFTPGGGGAGTLVTIYGNYFSGTTDVRFNGVSASFAVNSNTQIVATVPPSATTGPIQVLNPAGIGNNGATFYLPPTITALTPAGGPVNTSVTIQGTNFIVANAVQFNGVNASFSILSNTEIRATVPGGAASGLVAVFTIAGSALSPQPFFVGSAPTIAAFSPAGGSPGTLVTVDGTGFTAATNAYVNGVPSPFTIDSATRIYLTIPGNATTGLIAVANPAGSGTSATPLYVGYLPTVVSFSPDAGPVGRLVTVRGANFTGATAVSFGSMPASSFTVQADTQLVTVVPAGAQNGPISVVNPVGQGTSVFEFLLTPKINAFSPTSVPASTAAGTTLTITGWNFTDAWNVSFAGLDAPFTVDSDTRIFAQVPVGATTGRIRIEKAEGYGQSGTDFLIVQFVPPPATPGAAWPFAVGVNVPIDSSGGQAGSPVVAADSTGGAFIAWTDSRNGSNDIFLSRITSRGELAPGWPSGGVLVCGAASSQVAPTVIADGVGGAIVAWEDYRDGSSRSIYASRIDAGGTRVSGWLADGNPVCTASNDQYAIRTDTDGASGAFFAWQDSRNGRWETFVQRLTNDGAVAQGWPANGVNVTEYDYEEYEPAIVHDGQQGAFVAWRDSRNNYTYMQRFTPQGLVASGWPAYGTFVGYNGHGMSQRELVRDGSGGVFVVGSHGRVWIQRMTGTGAFASGWDSYMKPVTDVAPTQYHPRAISDQRGGVILAWSDYRVSSYDIYATRFLGSGIVAPGWLAGGTPLCLAQYEQRLRSLQPDGFGGAVATWDDYRYGQWDVFSNRVMSDYPSSSGWPVDGSIVASLPNAQYEAASAATGGGDVIVAWSDVRNPTWDIYAQNIGVSGYRGNPEPALTSVRDLPNDQGGFVRATWQRSYLDTMPTLQIESYGLWRLVDAGAAQRMIKRGARVLASPADLRGAQPGNLRAVRTESGTQYWEAAATVRARGQQTYSFAVPTFLDSTGQGNPKTVLMLEAYAATGPAFWSTPSDSGYSVDNLPPAMPSGFMATAGSSMLLEWHRNAENDLAGYLVHRGTNPDFSPGASTLIASTTDTSYADATTGTWHYKLQAVDVHGNASLAASPEAPPVLGVVSPPVARQFRVDQPSPNPFSSKVAIRLSAPAGVRVRVTLHDIQGRRVRELINGAITGDEAVVEWDGRSESGERLGSGVYILIAEAGGKRETRRIVMTR